MRSETTNEVRQKRPKGFYISDNELVDNLAAEIGIYAFGVYHLLMRKAEDRDGARVSQRQIRELLGISTDSARNAIATLKNAGLVEEVPSERPEDPPMYLISYAKDVLEDRRAAGKPCPEIGTRVKTRRAKEGVRNSEQGECENQDATAPNSGHPRPEFRTPYIEVNQTRLLKLDTPVAPASGGRMDAPLREVAGETVRMAPGAVMGAEFLETVMDETERRKAETERRKAEAERRAKAAESPPAVRLEAQLLWAVAGVMRAFSLVASRNPDRAGSIETTIHEALRLHCSKTGATPEAAAQLAMRMRKEFLEARPLLRHGWGWKQWFAGGHWCDSATWPYDREAMRDAGLVLRVPGAMRL